MRSNRNVKIGVFIVIALMAYILYTRPAKLPVCMISDKVEMMYVSIDIYKDGFSQRNEQTTFITEIEKIEPVLEFLNQYSFRKKIHNPYQAVGAGQKDTIRIIFHYKDKNDVLDIDIFEIGNEGKIRITQFLHGQYVPYTIGWIGKKQEISLHKDLSEMWLSFIKEHPKFKGKQYDAWCFGVSANELVELVLNKIKTATALAHELYKLDNSPLPPVGGLNIILDIVFNLEGM